MSSKTFPRRNHSPLLLRECFVTIGATAGFKQMSDGVLEPTFLKTLQELGYTHLTVQCGPDLTHFNTTLQLLEKEVETLKIRAFDFNRVGLGQEMRGCKSRNGLSREGVVLCHAGAGTVLDAMRIDVPIIVVPNPGLLDNHQQELAEELEQQGYVTIGNVMDLAASLRENEQKSAERTGWPPVNSGEDPAGRGLPGILDEELGYEARVRETLD